MLRADRLSKVYASPGGDVIALTDFSFTFAAGRVTAVMGPSGSGKSTLLNLLAGFDTPSSGEIWLDGRKLTALSENERAELRLLEFGFVFQSFNLISVLSAEQNVAFPVGLAGKPPAERLKKARALLARFGVGHRAGSLPFRLSGGERQRVAIARALANDPKVIFADEPTGNLDSKSGGVVLAALLDVASEGKTVIVVTHDPRLAGRADVVVELEDGRLKPSARIAVSKAV
ncbi:MAG: ABC transporter ATP-binding protein [Deinococcota bacterium]|jgi:putative ABC transport system ATP-binding protein|nr:ABC transporter ATP-binding protein [Deinococcota bacterium]